MVILMVILGGMVTGTAMGVPLNNATGSILISSTPPGAAVYLDSQYQGVTPESSSFIEIPNLTPKTYTTLLKKEGYLNYITVIRVTANETVQLSATLNQTTVPQEPQATSVIVIGVLVVIIILLVVAFIVTRKKKPEEQKETDLD
jgi:hypothetical protein